MKAILVLPEMPESCEKCPLLKYDIVRHIGCAVTSNIVLRKVGEEKPKWCPLRSMPENKHGYMGADDAYEEGYGYGFNDCLRMIEGSGEDD